MLDFLLKRKRKSWAEELVGAEMKLSGEDSKATGRAETVSWQVAESGKKEEVLDALLKCRHYKVASESVEILRNTMNPRTFFGRCDDIAFSEERITGEPSEFMADVVLQTHLQIDFINRVVEAGRYAVLKESMGPYIHRLTEEAALHYEQTVGELKFE